MELLGFGLLVIAGALFAPAVFILAVAFVYVRQHRGADVDIITGVSTYTVILVALGALLVALGVAQLLTAILAEFDAGYTYGQPFDGGFPGGSLFGESASDRQERDVADGIALLIAGAVVAGAHVWLRGWLAGDGRLDRGLEGAWDMLVAIVLGIITAGLIAQMLSDTLNRAITDNDTTAAGSTIARLIAIGGLWAVYAYRALTHAGVFGRDREGGPGGGEEI